MIDKAELDRMQSSYQAAVEEWISAIRQEETLASPAEHSEADLDQWEGACQREEAARTRAKRAKAAYESALRREYFNF